MTESQKRKGWDFPGGPVVKNPPSNRGDTGSTPGGELRSHRPPGSWACSHNQRSPDTAMKTQHSQRKKGRDELTHTGDAVGGLLAVPAAYLVTLPRHPGSVLQTLLKKRRWGRTPLSSASSCISYFQGEHQDFFSLLFNTQSNISLSENLQWIPNTEAVTSSSSTTTCNW